MNTYKVSFHGRQAGAIGITYQIADEYEANDIHELISLIWNDYDLIRGIKITTKSGKVIEQPEKIKWITVRSHWQRKRQSDRATYVTPCTLIESQPALK